jgi:hypothetical protein
MHIHSFIIAVLFSAIQLCLALAGELIVPSEPVVRGSIRSGLSYGYECLSVPLTDIRPGCTVVASHDAW